MVHDFKGNNMAVAGLLLGPIGALLYGIAVLFDAIAVLFLAQRIAVACMALGLCLSAWALFRRRTASMIFPISAIAVNAVTLGVFVLFAIVIPGRDEPGFDEAGLQLVRESGVIVQRITPMSPPVRYAMLVLPSQYYDEPLERRSSIPLVLNLHGYSGHYMSLDSYFGFSRLVNSHNFALLMSNGTRDEMENRFWNATDFCCGVSDDKPDDVAYLNEIVREAAAHVNIDRVFVIGMSNGAFMAYRLACDGFPGLAGVVAIAGSSYSDPARCDSAHPVSVLHVHGTDDEVIRIDGGSNPEIGPGNHPAAREVVRRWATRAGCDPSVAEALPRLDMDAAVKGAETSVLRYRSGCRDDTVVEYWEMDSSPHIPKLADDFGERILNWLISGPG